MKRKIILILIMLVFCVTACGKHVDNSTINEANISNGQIATTEAITDADTVDEPSYNVNEILSDLTIDGVSIDWPCELKNVQKVFELGDSYSFEDFPDILWYDLYFDNNKVGNVLVSEENSVLVLSLSYRLNDGIPFEFKGVTENSSYSDLICLLGEPTYQSETGYRFIVQNKTCHPLKNFSKKQETVSRFPVSVRYLL